MKLVSFAGGFGRLDGDTIVEMGPSLLDYLVTGRSAEGARHEAATVELEAPVGRPGKIICVGLNYRDHAIETSSPVPAEPVLFAKFANSIVGPQAPIVVPVQAREPDYEAELAVVIGRTARRVGEARALDHVAGYMCANDVSARDLQTRTSQWTRGKTLDTFLPLGPWLVTGDEIDDPHDLTIRTTINGEVLQDSHTGRMIWSVQELISFVSETITLEPGDILLTGTPSGVGQAKQPRRYLRDGDRVVVEIEGLGALENPVLLEKE